MYTMKIQVGLLRLVFIVLCCKGLVRKALILCMYAYFLCINPFVLNKCAKVFHTLKEALKD